MNTTPLLIASALLGWVIATVRLVNVVGGVRRG